MARLRKDQQILFHFGVCKRGILTLTYIKDMSQSPPAPYLETLAVFTKLGNKSLKYMFFIHLFCTCFAFHILTALGQKLHLFFFKSLALSKPKSWDIYKWIMPLQCIKEGKSVSKLLYFLHGIVSPGNKLPVFSAIL